MQRVLISDGEQPFEPDPDVRTLSNKKAKYGRVGANIELRWINGVFQPEISVPRDRNGSFDPAIRKINFTTNAIESLNGVIRKSIKTRGSFSTEESAMKLIYLVIRNFEEGGRNIREWFAARNQFAIMFEDRFNA